MVMAAALSTLSYQRVYISLLTSGMDRYEHYCDGGWAPIVQVKTLGRGNFIRFRTGQKDVNYQRFNIQNDLVWSQ